MRDIVSGVWPSVTISQFLQKFFNHYSVQLEAKDLGFDSIQDFLSHVDNSVRFQDVNGITHLFPSEKYLNEKPPVLAGLHGKRSLQVADTLLERNPSAIACAYSSHAGAAVENGETCHLSVNCDPEATALQNNLSFANVVLGSRHHGTDCRLADGSPIAAENVAKCIHHSRDAVTSGWKVPSTVHHVEESQGAGNGLSAMNSNPHSMPELNPPTGVLLNSANAQDVYRILEQAVDAGIQAQLKNQVADTQNQKISVSDLGQTSVGTGGTFIGLAQEMPLETPFTSTGLDTVEFPSIRTFEGYPNGVSPCSNSTQMSGYCDSRLAQPSTSLDMEQHLTESKSSLYDVLNKVKEVLRKAVIVNPTPVLLNKLPLLYFNEFRHALDCNGLGLRSLGDLVNLLDDFVLVADSSDTKMIVPRGTQGFPVPVLSQMVYQMPQSPPQELQPGNGNSPSLMLSNQVPKLGPFQQHMPLNPEGHMYGTSTSSSHILGGAPTQVSGTQNIEDCALQQQALPSSTASNLYVLQSNHSQEGMSNINSCHPQLRGNGNCLDFPPYGADKLSCNPISLDLCNKTIDIQESWPRCNNHQRRV